MLFRSIRIIYIATVLMILQIPSAHADEASNNDAQSILHMLDYVSVDYGGSVLYGKVLNEREFNEQLEFAEQAAALMNKLPAHPNQAALIADAAKIAKNVKEKSPADYVSVLAQKLRKDIIETYQVPVSPRHLPELLPALALYQQLCVPCHGATGHGDGSRSKELNPRPADFYNDVRMGQRSVYGLYNSISLGVSRTAMTAFSQLSEEDRWGLAFLVSNFRIPLEQIEQGRKLWENRNYHGPTPDLNALTTLTGNEISARYGEDTKLVYRYLRSEPKALLATPHATLISASEQLDIAMMHYREGNQTAAQQLAIAAYLDGFQPIEISLDAIDKQLRRNIEIEMMNIRQLISSNAPADTVAKKINLAKMLLKQADENLRHGSLSVVKIFVSAISILFKESLGGILVLASLLIFVVRIGREKDRFYIYAGWGTASLLGGLTWIVATWMTELSGVIREITSGVTALIASAMLVYIGLWLYNKTHWKTWQTFKNNQPDMKLKKRVLWVLALLSFCVVYRAAFEAALFYEALWVQTSAGTNAVIWSGMLTSGVILSLVGMMVFRIGLLLSGRALFTSTAILLAILSITFAGQGVSALQKAGIVSASKMAFASTAMPEIFPNMQVLLTQFIVVGLLILGYFISMQRRKN